MADFAEPRYLNYDNSQDRAIIRDMSWPSSTDFLILDEVRKMPGWKDHLKGIYDTRPPELRILVTGSARLETCRQGGDSLDGLVREDILSFENVRELRAIGLLVELLRDRVGSPLSYQSLSEDIGVSPNTVKRYVEILEALYIVFLVHPFARDVARSLRKIPKLYFFDSGLVRGDEGSIFENLVALSLLKRLWSLEDRDGRPRRLAYLRTKEGKEVDFVLVEEERPTLMVEAKVRDREVTPALHYFRERYGIPGAQLVVDLRQEYDTGGLAVRKASDWLAAFGV
jgi:predicted AAA+ superfamily ATPase